MAIIQANKVIKPKSPKIDSELSKKSDRKEYYAQRYQAKKQEWHQWYLQRKQTQEKQEKENQNKLYQANSIKVLLSLKEYSELNQEKRKLWLDFMWTFKDLNKTGFFDIIQIQKLEQLASNLIRDYYQTAQGKAKSSWNSLTEEQQSKLIKYWGREKVRKENYLLSELEQQEEKGKAFEKEIELVKFHEERGKIKCPCWKCAESKRAQAESNKELLKDNEEKPEKIKSECANCYEDKKIDAESGLCRKCSRE